MQRDFLHLHFFFRFILKRIFGYTLKCSIHIETFFCRSLKVGYVSLSSTPCLCFLLRNLKLIKWRQWGIFYSRDQHESGTFPPQHFRKCTFYEMFSNVRKMHVMKREESSCHEKGRIILSWKGKNHPTTRLLPPSTSILFPNTTNGKFSGSDGLACKLVHKI